MQPSPRLIESFHRALAQPLLINGEETFTGASLLARIQQKSQALAGYSGTCVICVSSEPEDILAFLCLPAEIDVSVLLVPDYLDRDVPALVQTVGASAIIRSHRVTALDRTNSIRRAGDEVLLLTSGTTAKPKVIRHKWHTLFARIRPPQQDGERVWLLTYLPTTFAGIQVLLTAAIAGDRIVRAAQVYTQTLAIASEQGVTHLSCTPTFLRALIAAGASNLMLPCLKQITLGGEIADQRTLNAARDRFPTARIAHIYAATETGALFSVSDGREGFPDNWLHDGIEEVRLRIVDDALQVNSPRAMIAYAGDDPVSAGTDKDWIDTGDLVRTEHDRVLFVGRRDRRINVGGSKTLPEDVERAILEVPGVADAVVTGVPNPISGEIVFAEVVPAEGNDLEELRQRIFAHIRGSLANHQIPRILRFTTNIPLSPSGKKTTTIQSTP